MKKTFIVFEVWTRHRFIEAESFEEAYQAGEPAPRHDGLSLCNWHIASVDGTRAYARAVVRRINRFMEVNETILKGKTL